MHKPMIYLTLGSVLGFFGACAFLPTDSDKSTIDVDGATITLNAMCRGRIVRDNGDVAAVLECGPAPTANGSGSLVDNSLRSVSNEHGANDGR